MTATDPRGETWTPAEESILIEWGKAARQVPYELLIDQFPGRTVQALRLKVYRLRKAGRI